MLAVRVRRGDCSTPIPSLDKSAAGRYDSVMPVNMDPKKKKGQPSAETPAVTKETAQSTDVPQKFGDTTDRDKEHALADAEWKNLWDATEVIDMDKW